MRTTDNACVRTAHTLHLGFKVCAAAGKVCGTATHAVGGDAGYGLLHFSFKVCAATGRVCGVATHAVGENTGYGLLESDILGIAAMNCNDDGSVKGFVGYKYPTYACFIEALPKILQPSIVSFPMKFQKKDF